MARTSNSSMEVSRHELLAEMQDLLAASLRMCGVEPETAEQISGYAVDAVCEHHGGQVIYIPTDHAYRLSQRDLRLLEMVDQGHTIASAARACGITVEAAKKVCQRKRQRLAAGDLLQMSLF